MEAGSSRLGGTRGWPLGRHTHPGPFPLRPGRLATKAQEVNSTSLLLTAAPGGNGVPEPLLR
jgi:hypothetical protein